MIPIPDIEKTINNFKIVTEEFLKDPDWSNFSLVEVADICTAVRVLRISGPGHNCKNCPFFIEVPKLVTPHPYIAPWLAMRSGKFCVVGRSTTAIRKASYKLHEAELYLEIVKLREGLNAILEEAVERENEKEQ